MCRAFNQAFLAVPALPSRVVPHAASDPEVVVREILTPHHGTYYLVIHTGMRPTRAVTVRLPARGIARDLVEHHDLPGNTFECRMEPGELRSYRVRPE